MLKGRRIDFANPQTDEQYTQLYGSSWIQFVGVRMRMEAFVTSKLRETDGFVPRVEKLTRISCNGIQQLNHGIERSA